MLSDNGKVYTMGNNQYGQLGIGREFKSVKDTNLVSIPQPLIDTNADNAYTTQPRYVFGITDNVTDIACGWDHCIALTKNKDIYSWGKGDCGQLGIGRTKRSQVLPTKIDFFVEHKQSIRIYQVSAGKTHSCFVSTKGRIFVCGAHYMTSMPHYLSKNITIDALSQIEQNCMECSPIEITIPANVDNHEKTRTTFIVRSKSMDDLNNRGYTATPFSQDKHTDSISSNHENLTDLESHLETFKKHSKST